MPSSINPERWQPIEELYQAALKLEPSRPSSRFRYNQTFYYYQ